MALVWDLVPADFPGMAEGVEAGELNPPVTRLCAA